VAATAIGALRVPEVWLSDDAAGREVSRPARPRRYRVRNLPYANVVARSTQFA